LVAVNDGTTALVKVAVGVNVAVAVNCVFALAVVAVLVTVGACADAGTSPNTTNVAKRNNKATLVAFFEVIICKPPF